MNITVENNAVLIELDDTSLIAVEYTHNGWYPTYSTFNDKCHSIIKSIKANEAFKTDSSLETLTTFLANVELGMNHHK